MTPLFPHDKEEKRQLTAVWLYGGATSKFSAFCSLIGFSSSGWNTIKQLN